MTNVSASNISGPLTISLYRNFGGAKTDRERLARVSPQKLWDILFNRRARNPILGKNNPIVENSFVALRVAGLEDPFEITPEAKAHVDSLFKRYNPQTKLDKAILLFRSVIPSNRMFYAAGHSHWGLKRSEGGLEIPFNGDWDSSLRKTHGGLLPKIIIHASNGERGALCLEYSYLLIVLLRAAEIEAYGKGEVNHAYAVGAMDKESKYRLDAAKLEFMKNGKDINTDRRMVAMHYTNKGHSFLSQGRKAMAIICCNHALEIDFDYFLAWYNKGSAFFALGKFDEAIECFDHALKSNPHYAAAWNDKGCAFSRQGKLEKAIECFDRALKIDPYHVNALCNKGKALSSLGKLDEAIVCYERLLEINPRDAIVWLYKGLDLFAQNQIEAAKACFGKVDDILVKHK